MNGRAHHEERDIELPPVERDKSIILGRDIPKLGKHRLFRERLELAVVLLEVSITRIGGLIVDSGFLPFGIKDTDGNDLPGQRRKPKSVLQVPERYLIRFIVI